MAEKQMLLRNTMRRPLSFRVAGRTVRLSPGEQLTVAAAWMSSPQLQRFVRAGLVAAGEPSGAGDRDGGGAGGAVEPAGEDEDDADLRTRGRGGGRKPRGRGARAIAKKRKPNPPKD